ncbi:hypothetical protein [Salmonirosea aquatica]|uniref:Uncharacterized protein n=1 Tax=Salmonirosea aquatica TaxID=2654236 RepID=A0A7C9F699_9BACT|nr:hypothetical protein [Cytophagaceae bacterium SJW1-29]MPR37145.1 hypothetical protein [Cytophagaceae bacterium SJW1-29]
MQNSTDTDLQAIQNLAREADTITHLDELFCGYLLSPACEDHEPSQRANIFETYISLRDFLSRLTSTKHKAKAPAI